MKETIAQKIISDAEAEAEQIIADANKRAESIISGQQALSAQEMERTISETAVKVKDVADRKAALARLDGAKIVLAEKHRVIDEIYSRAKTALLSLDKESSVKLIERLLSSYAEDNDGVYFAEGYPYVSEVSALPVVKAKHLRIAEERLPIEGGVFLKGEKADKDLSLSALVSSDEEENSASIANGLFGK